MKRKCSRVDSVLFSLFFWDENIEVCQVDLFLSILPSATLSHRLNIVLVSSSSGLIQYTIYWLLCLYLYCLLLDLKWPVYPYFTITYHQEARRIGTKIDSDFFLFFFLWGSHHLKWELQCIKRQWTEMALAHD